MNETKIENFIRKHFIKIIDDQKRSYSNNGYTTKYFQFEDDYNKVLRETNHDSFKVYTLEIVEDELAKIATFESEVMNHMTDRGHFSMFHEIMEQKEKEKILKDKYPAVKKAYEQYSLLLKLAESGEL